ncbi:hypothetical protein ACSBR1_037968 [Camellia fascicularis]
MPKLFFLLIIILNRVLLVDSSPAEIIGTTIGVGDKLNSTNIIAFEDGKFTLGFITISEGAGNFDLTDEIEKHVLWQSFDYPSSMFLSGMKLDFNSTTWQNWHLASWVSDSYLAFGAFALSWQPTTTTTTAATLKGSGRGWIVIYRRGELYRSMLIYDIKLVSNKDEKYIILNFTFPLYLWMLSPNVELLNEQTKDQTYEKHGDESGCVSTSKMLPNCRSSNDMFVEKRINVSVWDNDVIVDNNSTSK